MNEIVLAKLLDSLSSGDPDTCSKARKEMGEARASHGLWLIQALCHVVSHEAPINIHKATLAVLEEIFHPSMRGPDCIYSTLQPVTQEYVKTSMINSLKLLGGNEALADDIISCICACGGKLYGYADPWHPLYNYLLETIADNTATVLQRKTACTILRSARPVLNQYLTENQVQLSQSFLRCLQNAEATELLVQLEASYTFCQLMEVVEIKSPSKFQPLTLQILKMIEADLALNKAQPCLDLIAAYSILVSCSPTIVEKEAVVKFFVRIANTKDTDIRVRKCACGVLIACCQIPNIAKLKGFSTSLLDIICSLSLKRFYSER